MKQATVKLTGKSPLSFSKHINEERPDRESHGDFEDRTWSERMHYDEKENVFIPPMMIKNALSEAAKYRSEKIPGSGMATFTKHFEAGIMVLDAIPLGIKKKDVKKETLYVPSDGRRGGTKRVNRHFPKIPEGWKGEVKIYVIDEKITRDVLQRHLNEAGNFIGLGRFRPRNNGYYGRFDAEITKWEDYNG